MERTDTWNQDDLLQEAHDIYVNEVTESGLPLWMCEVYSYSPLVSSSSLLVSSRKRVDTPGSGKSPSEEIDLPF